MRIDLSSKLKRTRNPLRRRFGLALLGICSLGAGYVQELGPPAMRWQAPSFARFEVLSALPPLDMGKTATSAETSTNQAFAVASTNLVAGTGPDLALSLTNETAVPYSPHTPGLPYDAKGLLSPDWLATIFYTPERTNGFGTLAMPLPFIPPPAPQSSTATISKGAP